MKHSMKLNFLMKSFKKSKTDEIRPYKNFNFFKLIRMKSFLSVCKHNIIISNMNNIYEGVSKITGKCFLNKFVEFMYCDLLTGGANFNQLESTIKRLEKENIISIIDYCREFLTKADEKNADKILKTYVETIDLAIKYNNKNFIAIKISSLCDIDVLKIYNSIQIVFNEVENNLKNNKNVQLNELNKNLEEIKKKLNNINFSDVSELDLEFLKAKFNSSLGLNIIDILTRNEPSDFQHLNSLFGLEENVFNYGILFHTRVDKILSHAQGKKCSVMMDAEQSYIQVVIDSVAKFYTFHYNKSFCTVLQTIQCYLKNSNKNAQNFLDFIKRFNLKLGVKIVRGAYMTEESRLANQGNYENPIHNSIEDTHKSYDNLIPILLKETSKCDKVNIALNKIIIASHNEDSVELTSKFLNESNIKSVYSAQLVGISEHITILSQKNNLQTCKYIPFGDIDIMIPYLIRRAEESAIISKLTIQNSLLNEEIKIRMVKPLIILMILMLLHQFYKNNY